MINMWPYCLHVSRSSPPKTSFTWALSYISQSNGFLPSCRGHTRTDQNTELCKSRTSTNCIDLKHSCCAKNKKKQSATATSLIVRQCLVATDLPGPAVTVANYIRLVNVMQKNISCQAFGKIWHFEKYCITTGRQPRSSRFSFKVVSKPECASSPRSYRKITEWVITRCIHR